MNPDATGPNLRYAEQACASPWQGGLLQSNWRVCSAQPVDEFWVLPDGCIDVLCSPATALARRWADASLQEQALARALKALARADGDLSMEWLALQCGISTRHFQRRCQEATGLPPKMLARIHRLMRVMRLRQQSQQSWTRVAADCGYADQAHFIHDFTALVGCSPGAYGRGPGDVRFSQAARKHAA